MGGNRNYVDVIIIESFNATAQKSTKKHKEAKKKNNNNNNKILSEFSKMVGWYEKRLQLHIIIAASLALFVCFF